MCGPILTKACTSGMSLVLQQCRELACWPEPSHVRWWSDGDLLEQERSVQETDWGWVGLGRC